MAMLSGQQKLIGSSLLRQQQPLSEINVTPFVDVMLVLLVIFMITAPVIARGVQVDLPQATSNRLGSDQKPIQIAIDAAGQVYVGKSPVTIDAFAPLMVQMAQASGDPASIRVFVSADQSLDYGVVMGIVSQISTAGFSKVALLSDAKTHVGAKVTQ